MKPFAESCEQNKLPILQAISPYLRDKKHVLEIGSGTGQHAVFFGEQFPELKWQTADRLENHDGIRLWLSDAGLANVLAPLEIDACQQWPEVHHIDAVFSANTVHIMSVQEVVCLFEGIGEILQAGGVFLLYGPFNYNGEYTSESNARFDDWLKSRDPNSCIKHFEDVCKLAQNAGMTLINDIEMPANNRTLVWQKEKRPL